MKVETKNIFDAIISFVEKRIFYVRCSHLRNAKKPWAMSIECKVFLHFLNFFDLVL